MIHLQLQDKAIATKYKDYVLEEDFAGNIEIIKKISQIILILKMFT